MNKKQKLLQGAKILVILLASVFSIFPFLIMLKSSFEPYSSIVSLDFHLLPQNPSLDNYVTVCSDYPMIRWFLNSAVVAIIAIALNMVVDVFAAYTLARLEYPGKNATNLLVLCAQIVPMQVIVVPLYLMMVHWGWVDTYQGLILPVAISPFIIFFLKQNFMQIPRALDEAAMIDGCSRIGVLFRVILPNSVPALGTSVVLKFMWVWGDYMWPSLVSKSTDMRTLPVAIAGFQRAGGTFPWELIMPAAVLSAVPIILLFLLLQKYFIAGLTDGAVKG